MLISLALAGLSLLVPSTPTTDSWGWIVWGREVAHLDLNTDVGGSPAWKPLPVLFTLVFSLFGEAAPDLWLWIARAANLVAVAVAFRLAARLAGPWAGAVAAVALVLTGGFMRGTAHGYAEGLVAGALLLAFQCHIDGRRRAVVGLLFIAALARPEAGLFLVATLVHAWRRDKHEACHALAALALVLVAWMGADWWGSGDPLHAGETARSVDANLSGGELLAAAAGLAGAPVLVLAAVACVAGWRQPDRRVLALAGCVVAWALVVCTLVGAGWPGAPRFMIPAVAGSCVLAGVGASRAVQCAGSARVRRFALVAVLLLGSVPFVVPRAATGAGQLAVAERRALLESDLRASVRAAAEPLRRCSAYALPSDLGWLEGAVAWELNVPLERVRVVRRQPGVPAALAPWGPVLLLDQHGRPEPLMSLRSRRDRVLAYRIPDATPCLALLCPLSARPQVIGGEPMRIQLLGHARHWRVWSIEPRRRRATPPRQTLVHSRGAPRHSSRRTDGSPAAVPADSHRSSTGGESLRSRPGAQLRAARRAP